VGEETIGGAPESSAFAALVGDLADAESTVDQQVEAPAPVTR
jgi:hypothetical protein